MFTVKINPEGTRDFRIGNIKAYCSITDINERSLLFSDYGVAVQLGDHIWPALPWSDFDNADLAYFEEQIVLEMLEAAKHEKTA